jgi:hypothetical protein
VGASIGVGADVAGAGSVSQSRYAPQVGSAQNCAPSGFDRPHWRHTMATAPRWHHGKATKAQDAAVAPPDDKDAQAKTAQVDKMAAARSAGFDKAAFIAAVNQAIDQHSGPLVCAHCTGNSGKPT